MCECCSLGNEKERMLTLSEGVKKCLRSQHLEGTGYLYLDQMGRLEPGNLHAFSLLSASLCHSTLKKSFCILVLATLSMSGK